VRRGLALIAGVALLSAAPAAAAGGAKKTIKVEDNDYAPKTITVSKGTTVTWKWPGFDQAGDVHDVELKSGPKGVKKFHSDAAATDYSFKRKLTVAGAYKIVCTLHEEMHMTIRVKR
jgi:plastocyanin